MLDQISRDLFATQVNEKFQVAGSPDPGMVLELTQVSALRSSPGQESFSLVFRGPAGWMLPQQVYSLVNKALGQLDIFLVPVGQDNAGIYYEAVFNRLTNGLGNL